MLTFTDQQEKIIDGITALTSIEDYMFTQSSNMASTATPEYDFPSNFYRTGVKETAGNAEWVGTVGLSVGVNTTSDVYMGGIDKPYTPWQNELKSVLCDPNGGSTQWWEGREVVREPQVETQSIDVDYQNAMKVLR